MNKHKAKRLAEINSGINLKNAKASIANQAQDTFEAETVSVLVNRGVQHDEAVARAKTIRETIDRYNEAYAKSMAELNDYSSEIYTTPLEKCVRDIRNAFSQKEEK